MGCIQSRPLTERKRMQTKLVKDIRDNISWLKRMSKEQRKLLTKYLLTLDTSKRVDWSSEKSKNILEGVHKIMNRIVQKMKEADPRFNGNLVPMGSANNKTKISYCDEFDFVHELDISTLLKEKGTFLMRFDDEIHVSFGSKADLEDCQPFTLGDKSASSSSGNTNQNITCVLNTSHIHDLFCDILSKVLHELELPPGWCHGGFNRPKFGGMRQTGIAYLLQFDYLGSCDKEPLRLSVDFVPMLRIAIDGCLEGKGVRSLDRFIHDVTGANHCWISSKVGASRAYFSNAEELFLQRYSSNSMPKTVMRLCKVLGVLLKMSSPKFPKPDDVVDILKHRKQENSETCHIKIYSGPVWIETDDYVSYSDLGETVGDRYLIKSYVIKLLVMYMMMASESHGHNWTEGDLPDLVICVYKILSDLLMKSNNLYLGETMPEYEFSVPLENKSETTEDLNYTEIRPRDLNLLDTKAYLTTQADTVSIMQEFGFNRDLLALSRLSAVYQLLRSVCEGHDTAEIVSHQDVWSSGRVNLITKELLYHPHQKASPGGLECTTAN